VLDDQPIDRQRVRAALTEDPSPSSRTWGWAWSKNRWQVPLVLLSIGAILLAARYSSNRTGAEAVPATLDEVDTLLAAHDVPMATARLAMVKPYLEEIDVDSRGRYFAAIATTYVLEVGSVADASAAQATGIVEAYTEALRCGWSPSLSESLVFGDALLRASRVSQARAAYEALAAGNDPSLAATATLRLRSLARDAIEQTLAVGDVEHLLRDLDAFGAFPLTPIDEAWVVSVRATFFLDSMNHAGLSDRLSIDMRRLEAIDDGSIDWAPLHVLLGRAYLSSGRRGPAAERFRFVLKELDATGAPQGESLSWLGMLALEDGDPVGAIAQFTASIDCVGTPQRALDESRLGRAQALAQHGQHSDAIEAFIVAREAAEPTDGVFAGRLAAALHQEGVSLVYRAADQDHAQARAFLDQAIHYASLGAEVAFGTVDQRDAIRLQASAYEQLGTAILRPMIGSMDPRDAPLGAVSLTSRVEANHAFVAAGKAYLQLDTLADPLGVEADGQLLWRAATAFDLGGRPMIAVPLYTRYVSEQPADDDLRPEALFRLAVAFHSMLDYDEAATWYRQLIEEANDVDPDTTVSSLGTRARVGLARCLAGGPNPSDALLLEAEGHLRTIVDGRGSVGPEAPEYRDAMFQLGRVLSSRERWPEAVEVLETAIKRYPGDPRTPEYAARTGLAWIALAQEAAAHLEQTPLAPGRRADVLAARREAFERAVERLGEAIAALDQTSTSTATLDPLERQLLRMAYLRRADATAGLGKYEEAMEQFAAIERRFGDEVAAIEALMRMSNLAIENGDADVAQRATMRASIKLRRFDPAITGGPGVFDGLESDTLSQWMSLQPPGGDE
jgi:tetratricopeptide (TPR) repeat protein